MPKHSSRCSLVLALTVITVAPGARADDWRLGLEAVTDVPLAAGGRAWVEAPYGFHLDTSLGVLPAAYVSLLNDVVVGLGGYDSQAASAIAAASSDSAVWRVHLGWRPSATSGFYFSAGYGLTALGGTIRDPGLFLAALGVKQLVDSPDLIRPYRVLSTLHMVDAEIGWMWAVFDDRLTFRFSIGFAGTLESVTTIEPQFAPADAATVEALTEVGAQYLDRTYTTYLFLPVLSAAVGYRFL